MKLLRKYPDKVHFATLDGIKYYLLLPEWECDWYWGLGRLDSTNEYIHIKSLGNSHMFRNIKDYFDSVELTDEKLWVFCELMESLYTLKDAADLFHLGGSYIITNPKADMLKNPDIADEINSHLIPHLIDEMYKLFGEVK